MRPTKCKRCDAENMFWSQNSNGKWQLKDERGNMHHCDDGKLKAVKCKYCNAADLHWAEEVNPHTQDKKAVLTESYGLPHACDERLAFLAKEKQDKKDKYEAEKTRVNAHPEGRCTPCNGTGNNLANPNGYGLCTNCHGHGSFTERTKKAMLASTRQKIWPNMQSTYGKKW